MFAAGFVAHAGLKNCNLSRRLGFTLVKSVKGGRAQQVALDNEMKFNLNREKAMKKKTIIRSIVAAVLISSSAAFLTARAAAPECPFGHEPGYGRSLTPEQKEAHRALAQQVMSELRQKQADGTLTDQEKAWLQRAEKRGGTCLTGTPRGGGAGKGQGLNNGRGQGKRQGLRDGTGPHAVDGICPNGKTSRRGARR
jgi:hypothetical protein